MSPLLIAALIAGSTTAVPAPDPPSPGLEARVFVLKRTDDGVTIDAVPVGPGETRVFMAGPGSEVIDVIFPVSAGRSAGLVPVDEKRTLIVSNTGEALRYEIRSPDGDGRQQQPPRSIAELERYDIRVNVTGPGVRAAFLITEHSRVQPDVGPVANMFAGRVPQQLLDAGYVVQTATYRHQAGAPVVGRAPLELDRWPLAKVARPGGEPADFIVDIGAAGTVVARGFLPEALEIEKASMVEYSAAGKRTLKYTPGGATGTVETVLGHASLAQLHVGDVAVDDVTVTVLERMPDMFGRPVAGILGLDVLRRCEVLVMEMGDRTVPSLQWADRSASGGEPALELPFAFVGEHLVVEGRVDGSPVFMVLDTGAPEVFLDGAAGTALGIEGDARQAREARGLDEGAVEILPAVIPELRLGARTFADVPCKIGALAAFDTLRAPDQHVGLLGNSIFTRFSRIEIDFAGRLVRFVE